MTDNIKGKPGSLTNTAFNTGVIVERERIIKLLEDKGVHEWHDGYEELTCDTCNNIALIKGVNK